jgi:molecular chaperone DnaK (HSP70)
MEGESENPEACVELGTCMIKGLPDGLPQGTPIEVAFECTHDGRLNVTARLPTLQQVVQSQIHRTMGMDEESIQVSRERLAQLIIE